MSEVLPTFRDNRDRIVYLLAEYKLPISLTVICGLVALAAIRPELPNIPPKWVAFTFGFGLLCIPGYVFGTRIADWLYPGDWKYIGIADPGTEEIYDGKKVPKKVWNSKTVTGATPLQPDEGIFDYVVTRYEWYGDLGELEVRGCERADLTPGEAWETKERVDDFYEHHHDLRRRYSRLKATTQEYATQIHDLTIMRITGQVEEAQMDLEKSVADLVQEMEEKVGDLPDGPGRDERRHAEKWADDLADLPGEQVPAEHDLGLEDDLGSRVDQQQPAATDGGQQHE